MSKIKVSDLSGVELDFWVAKAEGRDPEIMKSIGMTPETRWIQFKGMAGGSCNYSTNWDQGGPIIEREKIEFEYDHDNYLEGDEGRRGKSFMAWVPDLNKPIEGYRGCYKNKGQGEGPTHLIAAMRAWVASKFGDTVEKPV